MLANPTNLYIKELVPHVHSIQFITPKSMDVLVLLDITKILMVYANNLFLNPLIVLLDNTLISIQVVLLALAHVKLANLQLNVLLAVLMDTHLMLMEFVNQLVVMDLFWEDKLVILD